MVRIARRLTRDMLRNHTLKEKTYETEATLESKEPHPTSEEALVDAERDEMIHKVYRAALRKMKVHADREGLSLLVHPRITYLKTDTVEGSFNFRGVLTLKIEAEAYIQ